MNQKGHKIALSGSYSGNIERLLDNLPETGVTHFSFVGREVTLQVNSENLKKVMQDLKKHGVENLAVIEVRRHGVTFAGSGSGCDDDELVRVSLIPAILDEGVKSLAVLEEFEVDEKVLREVEKRVREILDEAGVTDALYTIYFKKSKDGNYVKAAQVAALNAIFESGGVVSIE